jgi:hypothetical protein
MTRVTIDVNELSPADSAAVDVVVPPPPDRRTVHLRWAITLVVAAAFVFGWLAGVIRPTVTSLSNTSSANWSTDTGVIVFEFSLRNDGLSPAEIRGFEFDRRWGNVTAATTLDGRSFPVAIPRGEQEAFRVTVQGPERGCTPPSALSPDGLRLDGSLLRAHAGVSWLPFDHDVALTGVDGVADMPIDSICAGD